MSRGAGRLCRSFARDARYSGRLLVESERLRRRTARGFYRKDAKGDDADSGRARLTSPRHCQCDLGNHGGRLRRSFARNARYSGRLLVASEKTTESTEMWGSHRPHTPMKAQGALPQFLGGKKFLQSILLAEQSAHLSYSGSGMQNPA